MRLTTTQIREIHQAIREILKIPFELYLYGSRADDAKKGGDIDLAMVVEEVNLKFAKEIELKLLVHIKKQPHVGERRIDLCFFSKNDLNNDPFAQSIVKSFKKLEPDSLGPVEKVSVARRKE